MLFFAFLFLLSKRASHLDETEICCFLAHSPVSYLASSSHITRLSSVFIHAFNLPLPPCFLILPLSLLISLTHSPPTPSSSNSTASAVVARRFREMSTMVKMNGNNNNNNNSQGRAATNIWQVMNYPVPRGYVSFPSSRQRWLRFEEVVAN